MLISIIPCVWSNTEASSTKVIPCELILNPLKSLISSKILSILIVETTLSSFSVIAEEFISNLISSTNKSINVSINSGIVFIILLFR